MNKHTIPRLLLSAPVLTCLEFPAMSDEVLAPIIAIAVLGGLFLWIPTLDLCN